MIALSAMFAVCAFCDVSTPETLNTPSSVPPIEMSATSPDEFALRPISVRAAPAGIFAHVMSRSAIMPIVNCVNARTLPTQVSRRSAVDACA